MLVSSRGLPSDSTWVPKAEPGLFDIKRHGNGIIFISLPSRFTLQTSNYDVIFDFCVDSASLATSLKRTTSSLPDKGTRREIDNVDQATRKLTTGGGGEGYKLPEQILFNFLALFPTLLIHMVLNLDH